MLNFFNNSIPTSAYIHIPFCRRRCFYCDFPISVVGESKFGDDSGMIREYVAYLQQEIDYTPSLGAGLTTVFFGGGTPSLLSVNQVRLILERLDGHFGITSDAEISMEVDPGTFDLDYLFGLKGVGVNRISLGVQAFQDKLLKLAGRSHDLDDVFEAINLIQEVDFNSFSLDLISGLPGQDFECWEDSLLLAIAFSPDHISVYDLIVEEKTPFSRQYKPGIKPLPGEEDTAMMYRMASAKLQAAGYEHYEISNYAKPNHQCRHNLVYWENRSFYGLGMGAASYIEGKRFSRPRTRQLYYEWLANGLPIDIPVLSLDDVLLETLMLGLRLAKGLEWKLLVEQFGVKRVSEIKGMLQPYGEKGLVEMTEVLMRLSDPEGFLFSNVILTDLFQLA